MPGPVGGALSTWRDEKDDDKSKKNDDNSKKDDDLFHPWLVENQVKKDDDDLAKKEDAGSASKLAMPGPGEKVSSGAEPAGGQEKMAGKKKL